MIDLIFFCNNWSVSFSHEYAAIVPIPYKTPALKIEFAFKLKKTLTLMFHICYFSSELELTPKRSHHLKHFVVVMPNCVS